jgi:type II secretory pathway pseudopilin PulG
MAGGLGSGAVIAAVAVLALAMAAATVVVLALCAAARRADERAEVMQAAHTADAARRLAAGRTSQETTGPGESDPVWARVQDWTVEQ